MDNDRSPKTLNLYPIDYPFETLVQRIKSKPPKLVLDPEFQRKYKWDTDGWSRASKFIESCLMRIPLPSCYFAETPSGAHEVIDGVQRLTTVQRFFEDGFPLEGLSAFKEIEGKRFSELGDLRAELESTTIRCIVLRKDNPKYLVREIFARLNQGAVQLSDQEIRHAIYPGPLDDLLQELGETPEIKNFGAAKTGPVAKNAREADEQVLRFLAFAEDENLDRYSSTLRSYLDEFTQERQNVSTEDATRLRSSFSRALENCKAVFGDRVFTNPGAGRPRQGLVHYDLLMVTLSKLDSETARSRSNDISNAYTDLCGSENFKKTLSGGLQNKTSILRRRKLWRERLARLDI